MNKTPSLQVEGIHHQFGNLEVLREVSFSIDTGDVLCLLGPSGSGKTTLLKILAGLIPQRAGRVLIDGIEHFRQPTSTRDIGFVFQQPDALFPHLNVWNNVAFPFRHGKKRLKIRSGTRNSGNWRDAVNEVLHLTGLDASAHRPILELSGGMQQRVALARAIVYEPALLLLDEPLSSLDNILKKELLTLLYQLHERYQTTMVYITHDEREALQIATHLGVLDDRNKAVFQFGSADQVRLQPSCARVAEILGLWNVIPCICSDDSVGIRLNDKLCLPGDTILSSDPNLHHLGVPIAKTRFFPNKEQVPTNQPCIPVRVIRKDTWHQDVHYHCAVGNASVGTTLIAYCNCDHNGKSGYISFAKEAIYEFPA